MGAKPQEGGGQAVGRPALQQLTLNLKSSWLVEPFMVNDCEKLRKERGFWVLMSAVLAIWASDSWPPKSPQPRLSPGTLWRLPSPHPKFMLRVSFPIQLGNSPPLGEFRDLLIRAGIAVLCGRDGAGGLRELPQGEGRRDGLPAPSHPRGQTPASREARASEGGAGSLGHLELHALAHTHVPCCTL